MSFNNNVLFAVLIDNFSKNVFKIFSVLNMYKTVILFCKKRYYAANGMLFTCKLSDTVYHIANDDL